jgi:MFS family permease
LGDLDSRHRPRRVGTRCAIANIALPTIAREIGANPTQSIWVINAYQLAGVVSLLPFASLGDIFGYRRIYVIGLAVFTAAALVSALSHSLAMLALGRALQGLGAAGMTSVDIALVRFTYPRRQLWHCGHRGRSVDILGCRPDCRLGDPCGRIMAMAFRGRSADRPRYPRPLAAPVA